MVKTIFPQKSAVGTLVITILSKHYPLSKMKLYNKIKADYGKNITYQGVWKVVNELVTEGILQKQGKDYLLHKEWIEDLKKFSSQLSDAYKNNESRIIDKTTTEIIFYNCGEWVDFIVGNLNTDFFDIGGKRIIAFQSPHLMPIPLSKSHYSELKKCLKSNSMYAGIASNSKIDKIIAKFLKMFKINIENGVKCGSRNLIICTENCLATSYFPDEILNEEERILKEAKSLENLKLYKFYKEIMHRDMIIHMTITRNKKLATKILNQTLKFFENKTD